MKNPTLVLQEVEAVMRSIEEQSRACMRAWAPHLHRAGFADSAANLAAYLALRRSDLRPLQRDLMSLGLSSLGRVESRVLPALSAVRASLASMAGMPDPGRPSSEEFFDGERLLGECTREVLGPAHPERPVALLVTCPSEAATDPGFMQDLAQRGIEAIRINCAHDDADAWSRMVGHARSAGKASGRAMRVFMDLAGPKIRTGNALPRGHKNRQLADGERFVIVREGGLADVPNEAIEGEGAARVSVECSLPEAISTARVGHRVFYDDGKLGARIERVEPWGLVALVDVCPDGGVRLKREKGLNFPDTDLGISALTAQDRQDLAAVVRLADGVGFSFVQTADDVSLLQEELARRSDHWRQLALVLKIETMQAVAHLPDMVVRAAGLQPTAVMIARGDLAVEIGFARTAEMQEEILWLGEAARVPVIWATQVLEKLVKTGMPSRGEMSDAAMAARAECVMLNKGPKLLQAIDTLDGLLARMSGHQQKKTPQLRRLRSW